jgi:hypothetical protein
MRKLVLLLNDHPNVGKSTLARCFSLYLSQQDRAHHLKSLGQGGRDPQEIDPSHLSLRHLRQWLEQRPILIIDVASGWGRFFGRFFRLHQVRRMLEETATSLSVVLPVTNAEDSFDSVIEATDLFGEDAEYLVAIRTEAGSEDQQHAWASSYASRVMNLFDAQEINVPQAQAAADFKRWQQRMFSRLERVQQRLFGQPAQSLDQSRRTGQSASSHRAA